MTAKETKFHCFYCAYLLSCPLNCKGICDDFEPSRVYARDLYRKYKTNNAEKLKMLVLQNEPDIRVIVGRGNKYQFYRIKNKAP